jgi:hypothetical protein
MVYSYISLSELTQMVYVSGLNTVQEVTVWVRIWQAKSNIAFQINKVGNAEVQLGCSRSCSIL